MSNRVGNDFPHGFERRVRSLDALDLGSPPKVALDEVGGPPYSPRAAHNGSGSAASRRPEPLDIQGGQRPDNPVAWPAAAA